MAPWHCRMPQEPHLSLWTRRDTWETHGLSARYVTGFSKWEVATVLDCQDFAAITTKGCMIITKDPGEQS